MKIWLNIALFIEYINLNKRTCAYFRYVSCAKKVHTPIFVSEYVGKFDELKRKGPLTLSQCHIRLVENGFD